MPNTRVLAKLWIEEHLAAGSRIGVEFYTPVIDKNKYKVTELFYFGVIKQDIKKFEYIISSSGDYQRFFNEKEKYIEEASQYEQIFSDHQIIKEISPQKNKSTGPTLKIIKIINKK